LEWKLKKIEDRVFLLGGHDLEMITIKKLLLANGYKEDENIFDKNLKWGAKLSDYQEELHRIKDKTIYGIELTEDITPPPNYKRIDHHNEYSQNDASLMQILKLLGKSPTREDELIISNDIGHIKAMRCIGATDEEIKKIRKQERDIQGVTAQDEKQAQKDIKNRIKKNGLYIIETKLNSFSPIVDNFLERPLLVYSPNSLSYYGDIDSLKDRYKEQITRDEAYHGRGYFGFDSRYLVDKNIKKIIEEIVLMQEQKDIISYHNFMFPFRFDKITQQIKDKHEFYQKEDFDNRVKIDKEFKKSLEANSWEYQKFEVKNHLDYNEIVYFHDFVKDSLFNTQDFIKGATSYYFEKKLKPNSTFELKIRGKEDSYKLILEGVNLRLFDTGVGILSLEVENYDYYKIDDILKINDFGRRIYPQFLGDDFSVESIKYAFLPEAIIVNGIEERFCDLYKEIKLAKYIIDILGDSFTTNTSDRGKYFLQPIIDDRMFVLSWYGNDAFSSCTQSSIESDNWYRYVFVDGKGITVQDKEMKKELIDRATYKRWNNYGTFFGITRYSFVCATPSLSSLKKNNADFIVNHIKTMYFQMVSLLLVQRASLLRFSDEITAISDVRGDNPSIENISILYKNYLRFVNKLYFKEVTPQDQGIELYDKAIDILNIKRDIEDLRNEIASLNSYAFLEQEREEKEEMNKLTKLGTLFLPPTFIAGFLGMNVFPAKLIDNIPTLIITSIIIFGVMFFAYKNLDISWKDFIKVKKDDT